MASEDTMRDTPAGDVKQPSLPNDSIPQLALDHPKTSDPSSNSDVAGPNRRNDRNKQANGKINTNERRKGQVLKANGSGRGGDNRGPKDKRGRNEKLWQERKRRRLDEDRDSAKPSEPSYMSIQFPEEEIAAEERKPKRKVAVMIGYDGTGYHGLQINHKEKTIEGDIFAALVAANAISKANADDLRKSSFVRCARTDKGVHAAGNMISLKLIIGDPDLKQKINDNLPPQIRVWGIQRTNNSFSCYQSCDSRWYEYLMPSYCLLPPHPESFLGKKVLESVKENDLEDEYTKRLGEVKDYWEEVRKNDIQPILDSLDPNVRETVMRRAFAVANDTEDAKPADEPAKSDLLNGTPLNDATETTEEVDKSKLENELVEVSESEAKTATVDDQNVGTGDSDESEVKKLKEMHPVDRALKQIKAAYIAAKRRYRVTPERISQLQQALDRYKGTHNFHNYTIRKSHSDPSAKRTIRSFIVNPQPIQINDTEWLSLKVHGQSFMMHQIRKMVGMAVLVTRCATPFSRIDESYEPNAISIPKAPGLGLLLERPVFETYNKRARDQFGHPELDFGNYEKEIQEFKDSQIYRHIFELEERENSFHTFFHQIDNYKLGYFLWVTAGGISDAVTRLGFIPKELEDDPEEDVEEDAEG